MASLVLICELVADSHLERFGVDDLPDLINHIGPIVLIALEVEHPVAVGPS